VKVLLIHNRYQIRGGEDEVFDTESALLEAFGFSVYRYIGNNEELHAMGRLEALRKALWNSSAHADVTRLVRDLRPAVVHVHNTFPLLSPSVHHAAKRQGAAVVLTLHNYRLLCPSATFFRNERICEDCAPKRFAWPAVVHRCYRGSRSASAATAGTLALHRARRTWTARVDLHIALTEFARQRFIAHGFPADRIRVKPNVLYPDPGLATGARSFGLYAGRLSPEKGIRTLLEALRSLGGTVPFRIAGEGPLEGEVRAAASEIPGLAWLGRCPQAAVAELLGNAAFLAVPSQWYEGFPRVIVESFARGTPVLAAKIGSLEELVAHGRTGLHFAPGNADDLAQQMRWLWTHAEDAAQMGLRARAQYGARYSAEANVALLREIYEAACGTRPAPGPVPPLPRAQEQRPEQAPC
jgi:glycosyltransferase involved in cell wall biosynthesis